MAAQNQNSPPAVGYSAYIGFVYVFNIMLGAGVLALPKVFAESGLILGLIALAVMTVMSYLTCTFVFEAMAISNAVLRLTTQQKRRNMVAPGEDSKSSELNKNGIDIQEMEETVASGAVNTSYDGDDTEGNRETFESTANTVVADKPYQDGEAEVKSNAVESSENVELKENTGTNLFDITITMELGDMSKLFFNKLGIVLYYISICLYLCGTLSVYTSAISKSLTTVVCGEANCFNYNQSWPCHNVKKLNVMQMYRIMLACFAVLICPFVFFNVTKTKLLQIFTTIFRWFALFSMTILALVRIGQGKLNHHPNFFEIRGLPDLFGVGVYTYMMHHTLPAVLTPVINKKRVKLALVLDFVCVFMIVILIVVSALFAFPVRDIEDLYTLNFAHPAFFKYALELYPVLTLSATFPVLAIVLRENLKTLFLTKGEENYGIFLRRILFPSIVIAVPLVIAYCTYDVGALVGYTGAYAGAIIEYVIPAMLVHFGRRRIANILGTNVYDNQFSSPFRHYFWIIFVLGWYVIALVFVTYSKIKKS